MVPNNKKKLILATGIFPPAVGGPSTYVFELANELTKKGWEVIVVSYGEKSGNHYNFKVEKISRQQNIVFRYFKYFLSVLKHSKEARVVFAFDLTSSGLPAFLAALLRRKKTIVRIGGDFLWEKAFLINKTNLPLEEYYKQKKSLLEKIFFFLNKFFLKRFSKIVFTNDWMRHLYFVNYKISKEKTVVIKNPYPNVRREEMVDKSQEKKMIFAGRLIRLKNLDRVIKALSSIPEIKFDIYGEGPERKNLETLIHELDLSQRVKIYDKLAHDEFMRKLSKSYLAIVPSVTEVSPNTVLECIKLGVPVLATKECGFYDDYKDDLIFVDPMSSDDIRKKIRLLLKDDVYEAYRNGLHDIDASRSFSDVTAEIEAILR